MTSKRALPAGVVAYLALAGCGGSGDEASTSAHTTGASTATSGIADHVLSSNELSGFKASKPPVEKTVRSWLAATETPSDQVASEAKRLTGLGFIAGIHEDLNGPNGAFPVTGIPGAVGLEPTGSPAVNVAFASGDYYYLVGAFVPKENASSRAAVVAAAKHLYQRVQG